MTATKGTLSEDTILSAGPHIDRPGELLNAAVATAEEMIRAELIEIIDPRDSTKALATIGRNGLQLVPAAEFAQYREVPLARTGSAVHTRLDSFIAHVLRFKAENSVIFANDDQTAPRLTAVFDYHPEGGDWQEALNLKHRAEYYFPLSDQWKAWNAADGKSMNMSDFAAFLEDNIVDVVADAQPSSDAAKDFVAKTGGNIAGPSKLIDIARNLQVNENSQFREARNLSTGEAEVMFTSQHVDASGAKLVLPNLFMISIPVFARSSVYWQILARFRYRKNNGSISFSYELWRADLVFEAAFTEACQQVTTHTGLPMFVGQPEK